MTEWETLTRLLCLKHSDLGLSCLSTPLDGLKLFEIFEHLQYPLYSRRCRRLELITILDPHHHQLYLSTDCGKITGLGNYNTSSSIQLPHALQCPFLHLETILPQGMIGLRKGILLGIFSTFSFNLLTIGSRCGFVPAKKA